jgi:hypothetical protein
VFAGDDMAVATHGRALWILDDLSPLRQIHPGRADGVVLYDPAPAVAFIRGAGFDDGTPMPLEEPRCENPPFGAVIDYNLPRDASKVGLRILDAKGKQVAQYSSGDQPSPPDPSRLSIVPIWVRRPQILGASAGGHRFVWGFSDRTVPGDYTVELTVDGSAVTKKLKVVPDPRSKERR